jgi:hypothetical protein
MGDGGGEGEELAGEALTSGTFWTTIEAGGEVLGRAGSNFFIRRSARSQTNIFSPHRRQPVPWSAGTHFN